MNEVYRWSRDSDLEEIKKLLITCFGDNANTNAYDNIDGRYLLCLVNGKIVAMSGLCHKSNISPDAVEITWTCTHPDYRHQGIMQNLFEKLLNTTNQDIYCYCWKIGDKSFVNLHDLMDIYGFEKIKSNLNEKENKICPNASKEKCAYYNENCKCCEDLFLRKGIIK